MTQETRILYNAECPVCSFEIDHYAARSRAQNLPLRFEDLNACDPAPYGVTRDQAARRLHVLHDGQVYGGIDAFVVLWQQMPRTRWLARVVGLRGVRPLATFGYDRLAAPLIYRWHLSRQRRKPAASAASGADLS
jgi:predicted DCC family thiol-disulfide oxidoreductase YuxK